MRRGRRKPGGRDKVFGCDLLDHLSSSAQDVPQVLRSCSEFIEKHGIVDGIYRLSGVSSNTQKLRSEFDSEGSPDLYKEVYLQDIHCVSSLCKAYFRELPNPLLTYELYDRFADAVAVQLEDERLVKIREVLKDLPAPHYRTLEFLMRHLVKMSTFASETNMHSRNLAIVWAPNLLRSKDIESTGFNGTAAFMEVRVQSIVVEFVLTHVPELFPETGVSTERRKSLPSPSILSSQDDHFFKSLPLISSGNLSPGDGPIPMRPYHAIIDGTDKRKGSLKGRKWKSIFNLGARLHDPRKKNKYCPKDKEKTSLRPAKSMDSLSTGTTALEDSKHPQAALPPLVLSSASGSSEGVASSGGGVASAGGGVSSGYAVTYRRTGGAQVSVVNAGIPGSYTRLDSSGAEGPAQGVAKSPAISSKAERRAGMHITGPFSVTVPLHITSGLALGVLHGGWSDKEQTQAEDEDVKSTDGDSQSKNCDQNEVNSSVETQVDSGKDVTETEVKSTEGKEAETEDLNSNQESVKENVEDVKGKETTEEEYMDMRGHVQQTPVSPIYCEFQDQELDLQEAFGFLDSMDNSVSNQPEFSVEAPCFEGEYEEDEDEDQTVLSSAQNCTENCEKPKSSSPSFTHRPLPGKSHSLPYKSRPFLPALSLSSDDEYSPADDDDDDDDEDESDKGSEYEDMFCQSLPSSREFQSLSWAGPQTPCSKPEHLDEIAQSVGQSEDRIPMALSLTDDSKIDSIMTNKERNSVDVENNKHMLRREESAESEEDTYFGPDSIPSSPEPETNHMSVHEEINRNSPSEEQTQIKIQRETEEPESSMKTTLQDEDEEESKTETNEDLESAHNQNNTERKEDLEEDAKDEFIDDKDEQKQEKSSHSEDLQQNNEENAEDENIEEKQEAEINDVEQNNEENANDKEEKLKEMSEMNNIEQNNEENAGEIQKQMTEMDNLGQNKDENQENAMEINDIEQNNELEMQNLKLNVEENTKCEKDENQVTQMNDIEQNNEENAGEKQSQMSEMDNLGQNKDENQENVMEMNDIEQNNEENAEEKQSQMSEMQDLGQNNQQNQENVTESEQNDEEIEKEEQKQETEMQDNYEENTEDEIKETELQDQETERQDVEQNNEENAENEKKEQKQETKMQDLEQSNAENARDEKEKQKQETKMQDSNAENTENEGNQENVTGTNDIVQNNEENELKQENELQNNEENTKCEKEEKQATEMNDIEHNNEENAGEKQKQETKMQDNNAENAERHASSSADVNNLTISEETEGRIIQQTHSEEDITIQRTDSPRKTAAGGHQTRAVPAVPPKPQNSKLTALNLRKRFENRLSQELLHHHHHHHEEEDEEEEEEEERKLEKEEKRCVSLCFDEAVARATVKRSRENTDRLSASRRDAKTD
ncbi:rho GTPase-activating protein 30 [Danio aesculapii]|uniref:rho GTPase-activating protein 30 n=1 Tax=Danio aesculapii TaxID=1142201 RepID=UPI0024C030C2|nr:rho GTPase-activating protein 30 [Danio aesculapii]